MPLLLGALIVGGGCISGVLLLPVGTVLATSASLDIEASTGRDVTPLLPLPAICHEWRVDPNDDTPLLHFFAGTLCEPLPPISLATKIVALFAKYVISIAMLKGAFESD